MVMMIVVMVQMSQKNTVSRKTAPALVTCLLVIMGTVYQKSTFAMETMTVWMVLMKETGTNAVSATFVCLQPR